MKEKIMLLGLIGILIAVSGCVTPASLFGMGGLPCDKTGEGKYWCAKDPSYIQGNALLEISTNISILDSYDKCIANAWKCEPVYRPDGSWYFGNCREVTAESDLELIKYQNSDYVACHTGLPNVPSGTYPYNYVLQNGGSIGYKGVKVTLAKKQTEEPEIEPETEPEIPPSDETAGDDTAVEPSSQPKTYYNMIIEWISSIISNIMKLFGG